MAEQQELGSSADAEDLLSDESLDEIQGVQTPEPTPEPEAQPEPEVEVTVEPGTEVTVTPEGGTTEVEVAQGEGGEKPELIFGQYTSIEEAERGWREARKYVTETRQELAETRRALEEQEAFRKQVEPLVAQFQAQQQQAQVPQVQLPQPPADFDWTDPEQVRSYYGQLTQAQQEHFNQALAAERQRMDQQFQSHTQAVQNNQQQEAFGRTVMEFRSKHQDIDDIKAMQIAEVFKENHQYGFAISPENLELAYQVVSTPNAKEFLDRFGIVPDPVNVARTQEVLADEALKGFVLANPSSFTDTDEEGWQAAKQYAAKVAALQIEPTQGPDPKTLAKVTTGPGGKPAQSAPANNPYGIDPETWKDFGGELDGDSLAGLFSK